MAQQCTSKGGDSWFQRSTMYTKLQLIQSSFHALVVWATSQVLGQWEQHSPVDCTHEKHESL